MKNVNVKETATTMYNLRKLAENGYVKTEEFDKIESSIKENASKIEYMLINAMFDYLVDGNSFLDIKDINVNWKTAELVEGIKDLGITHFTYSENSSETMNRVYELQQSGCIIQKMVKVNDNKPAFLFVI